MYAKVSDVQLYLRISLGPAVWGRTAISRVAFAAHSQRPRQHDFARVRQHPRVINGCWRPVLSRQRKQKTARHPIREAWRSSSASIISKNRKYSCKTCRNLKTVVLCSCGIMKVAASPLPCVYPAVTRSPRRAVVFLQLTRLFYPPDLRDHLCERIND